MVVKEKGGLNRPEISIVPVTVPATIKFYDLKKQTNKHPNKTKEKKKHLQPQTKQTKKKWGMTLVREGEGSPQITRSVSDHFVQRNVYFSWYL